MADTKITAPAKPAEPPVAKPAPADPAPSNRTEDVIVRGRVADDTAGDAAAKNVKLTGADTHRATQRGYAVDQTTKAGLLIEEGELVPAGQPTSELWMEKVSAKNRALLGAVEEGLDPKPKDVDYSQAGIPALQALAMLYGINPGDLGKEDLITAIKAHREKDAG